MHIRKGKGNDCKGDNLLYTLPLKEEYCTCNTYINVTNLVWNIHFLYN